MGKFITSTAFQTPNAFVSSTAATGFPASNIHEYGQPFRPFKSAANIATTEYVGVDVLLATLPIAFAIDNINASQIKIKGADDSGFTTNVLTSDAITVSRDSNDGRYKYFSLVTNIPITPGPWAARRYWAVFADVASSVDTTVSNKFVVGTFLFLTSTDTWTHNLELSYSYIDPVTRRQFPGGGNEATVLGEGTVQLTLSAGFADRTNMTSQLNTVMRYGQGQPFLFFINNGNDEEMYIVKRQGPAPIRFGGPAHLQVSNIVLDEVV